MIQEFLSPEDDSSFKKWLEENPQGFYLNETSNGAIKRKEGSVYLHRVGCWHLGDGAGVVSTTYAKIASVDAEELKNWASEAKILLTSCRSCKPDGT